MNRVKLLDALELLDDDMLEATDALRRRKTNPHWIALTAAAACLCLVIAALRWSPFMMSGSSEAENYADDMQDGSSVGQSFHSNGSAHAQEDVMEQQMLYIARIRVAQVLQNGFSGMIISDDGHELGVTVLCGDPVLEQLEIDMTVIVSYAQVQEDNTIVALDIEIE